MSVSEINCGCRIEEQQACLKAISAAGMPKAVVPINGKPLSIRWNASHALLLWQPGERKTVNMTVDYQQLTLVNRNLEELVEPGDFSVMIGGSSRDQDLLEATFSCV